MTAPRAGDDAGFTLLELVLAIVIMGIITLPLANFVIAYFTNVTQTQARLSGSHDTQIAAAYFSRDVANMGVRNTTAPYTAQQSVWTSPTGSYCGSGAGTTLLLMKSDDWSVTSAGGNDSGSDSVHSVAYVAESGTLHRLYCTSGTTVTSDAPIVDNYAGGSVSCTPSCTGAPTSVTLTLTITSSGDTQTVPLLGQRRQSS